MHPGPIAVQDLFPVCMGGIFQRSCIVWACNAACLSLSNPYKCSGIPANIGIHVQTPRLKLSFMYTSVTALPWGSFPDNFNPLLLLPTQLGSWPARCSEALKMLLQALHWLFNSSHSPQHPQKPWMHRGFGLWPSHFLASDLSIFRPEKSTPCTYGYS